LKNTGFSIQPYKKLQGIQVYLYVISDINSKRKRGYKNCVYTGQTGWGGIYTKPTDVALVITILVLCFLV